MRTYYILFCYLVFLENLTSGLFKEQAVPYSSGGAVILFSFVLEAFLLGFYQYLVSHTVPVLLSLIILKDSIDSASERVLRDQL